MTKEEEMGADRSKVLSRRNEQNSYEKDDVQEEEKEDKEENKEEKEEKEDKNEKIESSFNRKTSELHVSFTIKDVSIKILFESIVQQVLSEVYVHEMPGVKRATFSDVKSDSGRPIIVTEGANYGEISKRLEIDMNKFYTNDIAIILKHYGIEAARMAIIKEVNSVFKNYMIDVDMRHLSLIADFVTNTGDWLGMSRHTMKKCASPLQQMSFETTTAFLTQCTMHGGKDMMESPSASLTAGNVIKMGSGLCEILVPFE
ncbi:DNA-directed RNA polymerase I 190 kDa polypeptide-related protein [Trichomonas vaginalis G3]|uniref:DNA-directed RNA polymerase n=1 Tax=Trichomonas vaginalis (strain ATCC PRA-98 / G3) TaxID=412133 RepID=A2DXG9_TRIV3|nr:DNA-directed RNA polymerase I 190 kDa polypeptide-related protein [Trichomonas vaginalis G3]|eukprot:XP_001327144.1 DNA-directed RNA polymerase I 190 kDa polypeptide-related protein [Trichomonas vaginalis G3]